AVAHHRAAELPRRQLLLDPRAAAVLADRRAVQSDRLPDQRLPLELLRRRRRQRGREPGDDAGVSRHLSRHRVVDVQDGVQAEEVKAFTPAEVPRVYFWWTTLPCLHIIAAHRPDPPRALDDPVPASLRACHRLRRGAIPVRTVAEQRDGRLAVVAEPRRAHAARLPAARSAGAGTAARARRRAEGGAR